MEHSRGKQCHSLSEDTAFDLHHSHVWIISCKHNTMWMQDEAVMLQKLRSQEVSALILDAPFVEFTTSKSCDLHLVGACHVQSAL